MPPLSPGRRSSWAVIGLLACAVGGCGLSDYENKMEEAQKRLAYFDREDKELAGPLGMPPKDDLQRYNKYALDVFLRVPKGVSTTPDKGNPLSDLFFRYAGSKEITALLLAWPKEQEKSAAFTARVYGASIFGNARRTDPRPYQTADAPGRKPLTLTSTTFELPDRTYHLYVSADQQVAIIFEIARTADVNSARELIKLSLGTLAFGIDALKQDKEYRARTQGKKK